MPQQVIAVDVDNTLTMGTAWTAQEMRDAQPNQPMIDYVNGLYKTEFIVIHTARRSEYYHETITWLAKHNVNYHSITMDKLPANLYIDDKALNPHDIVMDE